MKEFRELHIISIRLLLLTMLSGIYVSGAAQVSPALLGYPHHHLPWFTIESEHFRVHFQEGSDAGAEAVIHAAERVYFPITGLYDYEPDGKISIIIRDREDYSNGAAFFFDNKIEIWLPALDTPFRGTHSWIENVVAHEFTHMIQLGASMKRSRHFPAIYFQWLSYENVRRPDVLYGFPNGIVTLPGSATNIPAWFAEGTAQFMREQMTFDRWDSHRDMLLRTAILSDSQPGMTEMSVFSSKNSLERERIYNQGYSLVTYLADRFGEQILADISHESTASGLNNFHRAIEAATEHSAKQIYGDWVQERFDHYAQQVQNMEVTETESVECEGFLNFYPQFSHNGGRFAYLSNRGRDFSRTALVLRNGEETIEIDDLGRSDNRDASAGLLASHALTSPFSIDYIGNRFSFSPDGDRIVYSRAEKNRYGEMYGDLYVYDTRTGSKEKITGDKRIQDPAWNPQNDLIAAVQQLAGTQNLVLIRSDGSDLRPLTAFSGFETVYTPVWNPNGSTLYFAGAADGSRNLYRLSEPFENIEPVLENEIIDFRDPWMDGSGEYLYFSSDVTGIFNIYRLNISSGESEKLTEVTGGAFMPHVYADQLYISEFTAEGYKITRLPLSSQNHSMSLSDYMTGSTVALDTVREQTGTRSGELHIAENRESYSQTTTGLSVYPVIRFDNYTKLKGSNHSLLSRGKFSRLADNLVRDLKLGVYLSSRDVTERLSVFAGALIGPGSRPADGVSGFLSPNRINNLDRDLFLIVEQKGLPFIKRYWSPTVSVELYNLKRNVQDGLIIEEFACTSCLPEERSIDIRYSVWEASLWLRSKLNRWSLVELGATYTPYSVQTDGFFSNEFNEFIPGSTSEYFRGTTYSASYVASLFEPYRHGDIAPKGFEGRITYRLQPGNLLRDFEVEDGVLSPVYQRTVNQSAEIYGKYGFGIADQTTGLLQTRAFSYVNRPDDYFYLDYTGGLAGIRSYPFFAIGGQTTFFMTGSVITPLFTNIYRQAGSNTLDKIFARFYAETGNGWGGPLDIGNNLKTGAGAELRIAFNRNYLFPMKLFINGSYGFNRFEIEYPQEFISTGSENATRYGREFLFYFGLTFDFDTL